MARYRVRSFCLITSMGDILILNDNLQYLDSNDMNSSNSVFLKKIVRAINLIVLKKKV